MSADSPTIDQENTLATDEQALSAIYGLLALTMRYPDQASYSSELLKVLESLLESLGWNEELAAFQQWYQQTPDIVDDLRTEYTRLFITAAHKKTFPPYGSIYMEGEGVLR